VNVLRVAFPTPDTTWPAWGFVEPPVLPRAAGGRPIHATAATDLARAIAAAIAYRDGYEVFIIPGDRSATLWRTATERRLLGWTRTSSTGGAGPAAGGHDPRPGSTGRAAWHGWVPVRRGAPALSSRRGCGSGRRAGDPEQVDGLRRLVTGAVDANHEQPLE